MFAALDPGQARASLLPERVPLRFFGAAILFHVLTWAALVAVAEDVPDFAGGPGPVLAGVHVLTIGVLLMTAMGVSFQMLPVALGRPAPSAMVCSATFLLLVAATAAMIAGFALYEVRLMQAGAALAVAAVLVHAVTLIGVVGGARSLPLVAAAVWVALLSLAGAVGLAAVMVSGIGLDVLPEHARIALAHVVLAAFGFMGMLAIGLSDVVVPLFAMAFVANHRWSGAAVGLGAAALGLAVAGILATIDVLVAAAIVGGLAAATCHGIAMGRVLAERMRRRLGDEFILIRASWFLLPLPILVAGGLLLDILPASGPALFGFALLYGWLLTLLLGVLQRIVPLLASMHAARDGGAPIPPSRLVSRRPLQLHRWCHLAALLVVAAGIGLGLPGLIRTGALIGTVGAVAFLAFNVIVLRRTQAQRRAVGATAHNGSADDGAGRQGRIGRSWQP